ncbi:hypothetical protein OFY01_28320 [Streptomyces sp. GXMU-J5]|uniref:Integral membrane protein n=1 Tax=Streptomyces beihaiensis TaxID=2984495 RepID=A0ABT3U2T9_9ACTN|nr:hypothetical protein [Streptomyces beihaiensis]
MGIESDQIVYDYLSRVGDLAQQRQLPSATRMRLVSELRDEIDRRRARVTVDSPAAVRRILDRLGTPERLVRGAREGLDGGRGSADGGAGGAGAGRVSAVPSVPEQPTGGAGRIGGGLRKLVPRPRGERPGGGGSVDERRDVPSPPHLAGADELGPSGGEPFWWRSGPGDLTESDDLPPGFVGGVEIPDILRPPSARSEKPVAEDEAVEDVPESDEGEDEGEGEDDTGSRRGARRFVPRAARGGWSNPLLLLAAAALVAGAVLGNLVALLVGWAIPYLSRRLTARQKKWTVFGLPGLAVAGGLVWVWGRGTGRWGAPIPDGQMSGALGATWPWVLRCAAVASALYVVWRSQRIR